MVRWVYKTTVGENIERDPIKGAMAHMSRLDMDRSVPISGEFPFVASG